MKIFRVRVALPCRPVLWAGVLLGFALGACSGSGGPQAVVPPPQENQSAVGATLAPLSIPAGPVSFTSAAGPQEQAVEPIAPIPTPMETFRALAPEQGLKLTPLFATPAASDDARFKRLETAVQGVRNDVDTIMPTMVQLVTMEKDMRDLIAKLRTLTGEPTPAGEQQQAQQQNQPQATAPAPAKAETVQTQTGKPEQAAQEPVVQTDDAVASVLEEGNFLPVAGPEQNTGQITSATKAGPLTVSGLRMADHGATTRLVLDMTGRADFKVALQKAGTVLMVDLGGAQWAGPENRSSAGTQRIRSYRYENGKLLLSLNGPAQIKAKMVLPPAGKAGFRYVLDLAPDAGAGVPSGAPLAGRAP